jgi:hypothetical protein
MTISVPFTKDKQSRNRSPFAQNSTNLLISQHKTIAILTFRKGTASPVRAERGGAAHTPAQMDSLID